MAEASKTSRQKSVREGFLLKRQRGKSVRFESKRKNLKFESRYCVLTTKEFAYKRDEEKRTETKRTLPVGNIKIVEQVEAGTFRGQKCDFCFQVGDEIDVIYLVANDAIEMNFWMRDFRKVAKQNENTMLEKYHPGAFGSKHKGKWSCCGKTGATVEGCEPCSDENDNKLNELARSVIVNNTSKAETAMQPKMSHSFPRQSGNKQPLLISGSFMTTSVESDYCSGTFDYTSGGEPLPADCDGALQNETIPEVIISETPMVNYPQNELQDEMSQRSRTNTQKSDSGVDTDHGSRLSSNASTISQSRTELEKESHEDEGIAIDTQDDSTLTPQGYRHNSYGTTRTGKPSPLTTSTHIAVKRPVSSRISTGSTALDAVEEEDTGANMNMHESYVLSQPISAITMMESENKIVTGTVDGMVRIWSASLEQQRETDKWSPILKLNDSLRVAGEVMSIDVYKNYLAVGSALALLIDLSNPELPRKRLVADQRSLFSVSQHQKNLVAFARRGEEVVVVSASIGSGCDHDTVNIWRLPSWEDKLPFVMKPDSKVNIGASIESISCTTSKSNNGWIGVVSVDHNLEYPSVNLHLLNLQTSKEAKHHIIFQEKVHAKVHSLTFLHSGRKIAIGNGQELQIWETDTGHCLQSLTLRDAITSMHYSEGPDELSSGYLAVGLNNGDVDVIVRKKKQYIQTYTFSYDQPDATMEVTPISTVVALSFNKDFTWGAVVRQKGSLELWQATQKNTTTPRVTNHPTLGMELESEGIIDQLEILHHNPQISEGITSSGSQMQARHHVEIEVPNEVCVKDEIFSVEAGVVGTSPLGPFIFPTGLSSAHVVSTIAWYCSVPHRKNFSKRAKLKIPHCIHVDSIKRGRSGFCLFKADHTDVRLNKLGQRVIKFKDVTSEYAGRLTFNHDSACFTVEDNHFCLYCLVYTDYYLKERLVNLNFCITIVIPKKPENHEHYNIYCILHYNLETCKNLICEQFDDFKEHFDITTEPFRFNVANDDAMLYVEADTQAAELMGWQIVFDSTQQIPARRVNFLIDAYRDDLSQLVSDCNVSKTYPPRFVLRVAPQNAFSDSQFTLIFRGAGVEIKRDILLNRTQSLIPDPHPPTEDKTLLAPLQKPFQKQENGYWPLPNN